MDLKTTYLGLQLRTPLVASASPLSEEVDSIKRLEDAGASAVVLYSLFEEQIIQEQYELHHHLTEGTEGFAEALTYFPEPEDFKMGPEQYLEHIQKAKAAVNIPVIASLNCASIGGWTSFATQMEQAGADALELNIYNIPTDPDVTSAEIEDGYINIVKAVRQAVKIPIAIKLSPYFTNMANLAKRMDDAGANGLVMFNRFYQPDIDLESLEVRPNVLLSTSQELRVPLRWIAILYGRIRADMAATTGVHQAEDALKLLMVGANVTMMASALMRYGIGHIRAIEQELSEWLEAHEYVSVRQMQGSMSQQYVSDPSAFERAQYMRAITSIPAEFRP